MKLYARVTLSEPLYADLVPKERVDRINKISDLEFMVRKSGGLAIYSYTRPQHVEDNKMGHALHGLLEEIDNRVFVAMTEDFGLDVEIGFIVYLDDGNTPDFNISAMQTSTIAGLNASLDVDIYDLRNSK